MLGLRHPNSTTFLPISAEQTRSLQIKGDRMVFQPKQTDNLEMYDRKVTRFDNERTLIMRTQFNR